MLEMFQDASQISFTSKQQTFEKRVERARDNINDFKPQLQHSNTPPEKNSEVLTCLVNSNGVAL